MDCTNRQAGVVLPAYDLWPAVPHTRNSCSGSTCVPPICQHPCSRGWQWWWQWWKGGDHEHCNRPWWHSLSPAQTDGHFADVQQSGRGCCRCASGSSNQVWGHVWRLPLCRHKQEKRCPDTTRHAAAKVYKVAMSTPARNMCCLHTEALAQVKLHVRV